MADNEPWYFGWYENRDIPTSDDVDYEIVRTKKQLNNIRGDLYTVDPDYLAVDTETTSLDHTQADLVGLCFGYGEDNGYYIPISHFKGDNADNGLEELFYEYFIYDYEGLHLFYNSRFDLRILEADGCDIDEVNDFDVSLILYNGYTAINQLNLESIKEKVLGWNTVDIDNTKLRHYNPEQVLEYTAGDAHATWLVYDKFKALRDQMQSIDLDNKFIRPLKYIEEVPKEIDLDWFRKIYRSARDKRDELEQKVYDAFGTKFNIDSGDELRQQLKDNDLDTEEETPTGKMAVGKEPLENIEDEHEGVALILEYRDYDKHINTYIENFLPDDEIQEIETSNYNLFNQGEKQSSQTMYFSYRLTKTRSGRLSAGKDTNNPFFAPINIQNIPKQSKCYWKLEPGDEVCGYDMVKADDESEADFKAPDTELSIRHGIKAKGDRYYASFDHASQEISLIAGLSQDETMLKLLKEGKDVHQKTLDEVLSVVPGDYTRDHAKMTNFGVLYGAGVYRVKNMLNISKSDAEKLLDQLWETYPGVKEYLDKKRKQAKKDGYVKNMIGRPRWVKSLYESDNDYQQKHADNVVGNHGIQSMGAECIKKCTVDAYYNLREDGTIENDDRVDIESIVHDEINFSIEKSTDALYDLLPKINDAMEVNIDSFEVPIKSDCEIGVSWGKMAPMEVNDDSLKLAGEYEIQ